LSIRIARKVQHPVKCPHTKNESEKLILLGLGACRSWPGIPCWCACHVHKKVTWIGLLLKTTSRKKQTTSYIKRMYLQKASGKQPAHRLIIFLLVTGTAHKAG